MSRADSGVDSVGAPVSLSTIVIAGVVVCATGVRACVDGAGVVSWIKCVTVVVWGTGVVVEKACLSVVVEFDTFFHMQFTPS